MKNPDPPISAAREWLWDVEHGGIANLEKARDGPCGLILYGTRLREECVPPHRHAPMLP